MREVVILVIAELLGKPELVTGHATRLPRAELEGSVRYLAPRGLRRLRLPAGMVRANRPWRLVTGLSRVLVGAFASGAVGLVTSTTWQLADMMGSSRLAGSTVLSMAALIGWLVVDHELWERPKTPAERDRAGLYKISTLITLAIGVSVLYVAPFVLLFFTSSFILPHKLFADTLGHPVAVSHYLLLAWFLASIATVGGVLGSGLEDDEVVKAAAFGARQRQRFDKSRAAG
jgi:hypothetical protein